MKMEQRQAALSRAQLTSNQLKHVPDHVADRIHMQNVLDDERLGRSTSPPVRQSSRCNFIILIGFYAGSSRGQIRA